jgi:membrane-bound lytic murein transglycosylase B
MNCPRLRLALATLVATLCLVTAVQAFANPNKDFQAWLKGVREEARGNGISEATLDAALQGVAPIPRVIELDRRQAEFTLTFERYLEITQPPARVAKGQALVAEHRELLNQIEARFGVPGEQLVALWGMESNFGQNMGSFSVVAALATLAYDGRRSAFFRRELMHAFRILEDGHIKPQDMRGSWAGAMGQNQFMPSSFVNNAIDYDGDGRRDIWASAPDVLASAANYLNRAGWRRGQPWGVRVTLPQGFDTTGLTPDVIKPMVEWRAARLTLFNGDALPDQPGEASLIMPGGPTGPAFLAYENFRAIMKWNRAVLFATSAGLLADRLAGR